jgi:hypothetical protein
MKRLHGFFSGIMGVVYIFALSSRLYSSYDTLDVITVKSARPAKASLVNQKNIEESIGIVDDMNTLLLQKQGVSSIPEAGSMLLVNAEGPFDNLYLIRGIPIFAPSNFAGHTYADRSFVSLALPNNINFYTSEISGRYSGASGSIISIDPYILKTTYRGNKAEAAIGLSSFYSDFSLNFPIRKAKDHYQFSYEVPNSYILAFKSVNLSDTRDLGYGIPASAWNIRTLGEQSAKSIKINQLLWIGKNIYGEDNTDVLGVQRGSKNAGKQFPWGIFVLSASDSLYEKPWKISLGCSRQNYFEAQRIETLIPCKKVERDNIAFSSQCDIVNNASSSVDIGMTGEMLFWKGKFFYSDTLSDNTVFEQNQNNNNLQIHAGYKKSYSNAQLKLNSNTGFYYSGKALFFDPGIAINIPISPGNIELSTGVTSAPADIRGLPGPEFDNILSHTWHTHCVINWKTFKKLKFSTEAFVKYKDRIFLYNKTPALPYWDINRKASLKAGGGIISAEWKPAQRLSLNTNISVMRAIVYEQNENYRSDWDMPWATTTSLAFALIPDKMTLYCMSTFHAGLPYRDLIVLDNTNEWSSTQSRLTKYRCVDLKWEWRQPTDGFFLTEFDSFIMLQNILNEKNIRGYQWENGKYPISLQPITLSLGVRANFRFLYW